MPFDRLWARIRDTAAWISGKSAGVAAAVKHAFRAAIDWAVGRAKSVGQICVGFAVSCGNFAKGCVNRARATCISLTDWIMTGMRTAVAHVYRYLARIALVVLVVGVLDFCWKYWPEVPKPARAHRHWVHRPKPATPPPPDVIHRLLPREGDTRNADFYYLVNIIFVPLQTLILLVGGTIALWTLSQNHKFKQHDVEATCIKDYLAIEQQLIDAGHDNAKIESAARAYWVLMLYEYYWWSQDLLSRDLFANWCEFRVQRFRNNPVYAFAAPPQGTALNFTNYREGYEHFKRTKVFPSPSRFDDLMLALIDRAAKGTPNLRWYEIERYRHGWGAGI
jgi:hypothetical protein